MSESAPMEPYEHENEAIADYRQQSRDFLDRARSYLANDDLHQASEKGWEASAWMAKAVAEAQGWKYSTHDEFFTVMYQARDLTGNDRLRSLTAVANTMHGFFYTRKRFLRPEIIGENLNDVEALLDILQPLTEGA